MGMCPPDDHLDHLFTFHYLPGTVGLSVCTSDNYISIPSLLLSSSPKTTTAFWNVPFSVPLSPESQHVPHQNHYPSALSGSSSSVPHPYKWPCLTHQSPERHLGFSLPFYDRVLMILPLHLSFNFFIHKYSLSSGDIAANRTPHPPAMPHFSPSACLCPGPHTPSSTLRAQHAQLSAGMTHHSASPNPHQICLFKMSRFSPLGRRWCSEEREDFLT